ncbi:hypothetical protein DFS34DRAFT_661394 [Phlyctochytrium arcticum]|nr:hypothetical protein DFS34DRAFT_661394 [Phlyctochytrium arcticum]
MTTGEVQSINSERAPERLDRSPSSNARVEGLSPSPTSVSCSTRQRKQNLNLEFAEVSGVVEQNEYPRSSRKRRMVHIAEANSVDYLEVEMRRTDDSRYPKRQRAQTSHWSPLPYKTEREGKPHRLEGRDPRRSSGRRPISEDDVSIRRSARIGSNIKNYHDTSESMGSDEDYLITRRSSDEHINVSQRLHRDSPKDFGESRTIRRRTTRNSSSTLFAEDVAQQGSLADATDGTPFEQIPDDEDGYDEEDGRLSRSPTTRRPGTRSATRAQGNGNARDCAESSSRDRNKRKFDYGAETEILDNNEGIPYALRKRIGRGGSSISWSQPGMEGKSPGSDLSQKSRRLRSRRQVDYNEGRAFRMLYAAELDLAGGAPDERQWPPTPFSRPKKTGLASTVGGSVLSYESGDDEDDMKKPLLQYARCATLVARLPEEKIAEVKERLQVHVDNNDFPNSNILMNQKISFDMIGGHADHIRTVQEMVKLALLYPELNSEADPLRGVLFYGPPGNGKTLMARAIASSCSSFQQAVAFYECHASDVHSKWFGESEKHLKRIFEQAKANQPAIIFFDEIDGMVPSRSTADGSTPHNSVVTALLTLMDGLEDRGRVIVIGATNRLDTLDPALLRPGRFDRKLQFRRPDLNAREEILRIKTKKMGLDDSLIQELAVATDGLSGADLKSLGSSAYFKALRRTYPQVYSSAVKLIIDVKAIKVTRRDFLESLKEIKPRREKFEFRSSRNSTRCSEVLLRSDWQRLLSVLQSIHNVVKRRTLNASANMLQPRILISGQPRSGQSQLAESAIHLATNWGYQGKTLRLGDDVSTHDVDISVAIEDCQVHDLAMLSVPGFERWPSASVSALDRSLKAGSSPILVIATWESDEGLTEVQQSFFLGEHDRIEQMLGLRDIIHVQEPNEENKREYFAPLLKAARQRVDPTTTAVPPTALLELPVAAEPTLPQLSSAERKSIDAKCWMILQDLKQRLRHFHKEIGKTKYRTFCNPVDIEKYPDYAQVVQKPMDLGLIMGKLDNDEYEVPEDWLADIHLICQNAIDYNEARSDIVHKACELRDDAHTFLQAIPSKYCLNYLQAMLWRRAGAAESDETTTQETVTLEETTENATTVDDSTQNTASFQECLEEPGGVTETLDFSEYVADLAAAASQEIEQRLVRDSAHMDIHSLELLYQVLESECAAHEDVADRSKVIYALADKIDKVLPLPTR